MDFGPVRSRRMSHYAPDAASASFLSAWESSQHQPPFHRAHIPPEIPVAYGYRTAKGFPQFPMSPMSPNTPPSSMGYSPMPTPSLSEFEMLRRGMDINFRPEMVAPTVPTDEHGRRTPCLPTNLNFDFDFDFSLPNLALALNPSARSSLPTPPPTSPATSSPPPVSPAASMSVIPSSIVFPSSSESSGLPMKRSSSTAACTQPSATKKPRACISTKDFVPPDVTGLTKREARLVKNRAAAFLSRQRKREEFELMEIRVAELEQENQRLRDLADGRTPPPSSPGSSSFPDSELDTLKAQLVKAKQRESELTRRLEDSLQQNIKTESYEPVLSEGTNSGASSPLLGPGSPMKNAKSGASLGLMVLLCTLPSLLSQSSSASGLPTSQSIVDNVHWGAPALLPANADGNASSALGWEFKWSDSGVNSGAGRNTEMEVDTDNTSDEESSWRKLEIEGESGLGLGALDISFDTRPMKDGKIRVRVHSPAIPALPKSESTSSSPEQRENGPIATPSAVSDDVSFSPLSLPPQAGSATGYSADTQNTSFDGNDALRQYLGMEPSYETPATRNAKESTRRRVRIALRGLPQPGGEGGEWEVEVR